jgi:hypothetical protein
LNHWHDAIFGEVVDVIPRSGGFHRPLTGLLIFEPALTDSATKPHDELPVRRETLANPTDWKSVVQREFTHRATSSTAPDRVGSPGAFAVQVS